MVFLLGRDDQPPLAESAARQQPGQRGQHRPVSPRQPRCLDLTLEHDDLMTREEVSRAAGVAPAAARRTVREPLGSHGSHRPAVGLDAEPPVGEQVRVPASRGREQFPRLLLPAAQPFELPARSSH